MADIIQLLPDHVANQIAAGEVVQRPASVVKELLENAIDANAGCIKLIVKDGGKTLIQVVDDGIGMSTTDARLSFERHATSKIRNAEDLFSLNTKGFRGEALASIAAIAHVEMQTRPHEEELGTALKIAGSKVLSQEVCSSPEGTSIAVKNLFFNIPARRNFLKSDQVELRHITDEFHRVALAHPGVQLHFYHNGNELFNLPKVKQRRRIVNIFGVRMDEKLVPVEEETQVARIGGYICKPQFAKKSRGEQFFFVNNRFIKSPYLHHAVVAAFEGLIKPDTFPGYFLFLEVDPSSIDINIHPTKTEIKFNDEHSLYAILRATVKHSLGQFSVSPVLDFERDQNLDTPYAFKDKQASQPRVSVDAGFNPFKTDSSSFQSAAFREKKSAKGWENMYVGLESGQKEQAFSSVQFESDPSSTALFEADTDLSESAVTTLQIRRKYILTTIKSGLLIIDQGRAHQRVLYERFLRSITVKETVSQQLLFPLVLSFSKPEISVINEIREPLSQLGFIFDTVEGEDVRISGVPPMVPESEIGIVLDQLISDWQDGINESGFSQSDILCKTLAKTLAVKTGELLDNNSQLALVNDLFGCKESKVSPFNKPIFVTIPESDIDKKFI
ncbi:DNA mismatch repair endonuclease MutL [Poritiphilus flavus]|uniref:DNA mismatch repair protein MutL n=1 Tax=Poritiphilus flavus TaxID=2697053 RepID=A0A6L9E9F6_9FLAO|nr:DNA mismatch repair endonuclease MutL [Poritiphilus flavus]NAS11395.1 DNA mismatch repair endonuclease MutL [Poritiphilus flavus]